MKNWIKIVCSVSVLAALAPHAFAQSQVATGPSQEQVQKMYDDYYGDRETARRNSGALYRDGLQNQTGLFAPEEEKKKVYRYDGKDRVLYGVELPKRSFNNIQYPY